MRIYGLVDDMIGEVIEFFPDEEGAVTMLMECLSDEPEWEGLLRVEAFEFETTMN